MKEKSLKSQFVRYLIPSVLSLLSLSGYILADTFFVANGVGSVGLAALNIAIPAYTLINALALMFGVGTGVVIAVSRGGGDGERAQRAFECAIGLAVGAGVLFTVVGVGFSREIAGLLGASEYSLELAATYLRVIFAYSAAFFVNTTLNNIIRNDGNPRLAMVSMIANSLLNVVLDYVFVMVLDMGMWGAAFATGLACTCGIAVSSLHWLRKKNTLVIRKKWPDMKMSGSILSGGIANFITEIGNGLVILLFNVTLMGLGGDISVAAYGIVANIALVVSYIFVGVGQGMQPVIGDQYGRGNLEGCRRVYAMGAVLSVVMGIVFLAGGVLVSDRLTGLFNGDNDAELAAITVNAMKLYFPCFLFMGFNISTASYFQSMLRAGKAMVLSILRSCLLVIAGVAVLPAFFGINGVWVVTPVAEVLTCLTAAGLFCASALSDKRRNHVRDQQHDDGGRDASQGNRGKRILYGDIEE